MATQGEGGIKIADLTLRDDNGVIDLTDAAEVLFNANKPNGHACSISCNITDASSGSISLTVETGVTDAVGKVSGAIEAIFPTGSLKFYGINLVVQKDTTTPLIEASSEFSSLVNALNKVAVITPEGTIEIDEALSEDSANPVQNKVLTEIIENKVIKYVGTNDIDDCTKQNVIYRVYTGGSYQTLINVLGTYICSQYLFTQQGGIKFRTKEKSNDEWSEWSKWSSFGIVESGSSTLTCTQGSSFIDVYATRCYYQKVGTMVDLSLQITFNVDILPPNEESIRLNGLPYKRDTQTEYSTPVYFVKDQSGNEYTLLVVETGIIIRIKDINTEGVYRGNRTIACHVFYMTS
jgi:hypothetical protein